MDSASTKAINDKMLGLTGGMPQKHFLLANMAPIHCSPVMPGRLHSSAVDHHTTDHKTHCHVLASARRLEGQFPVSRVAVRVAFKKKTIDK